MQVSRPTGNLQVDLLQVVAAGVADAQLAQRIGRRAPGRDGDLAPARKEGAGHRCAVGRHLRRRAFGHHAAAVLAGAGTHVHHVVCGFDGFQVVLDHDHGVAEVAQPGQGFQQARVVALVQADRGFVEYVHHARQARADLRGQPDALRLAAGERFRRAVEREVVEADVDQEGQARGDFLEDLLADLGLLSGELQQVEEVAAVDQRQAAEVGNVRPPTKTWRASRRRRMPPHSGQGLLLRYFDNSSRTAIESVSR
jgi:hypothetical protein